MTMWNKTIYILFNFNTAARNRSVIFYYILCQCLESHFWQIWKRSFTAPNGLSPCWSEFCTGPGYGTMANQDKTLTSRFRWVNVKFFLSAGSSAPQTSWGYDLFLSLPLFQVYCEVADQSGVMSMVVWNDLCPEWFNRLTVGSVLYLQQYSLKHSYQNRSRPHIRTLSLMTFHSIGITPELFSC